MDDYTREMMDLKTLVTRTLEKKGVLARIRAELRANVFAAIEEEDRALENDGNQSFAMLGSCNERTKQLHASPTGKLLTALICDYLDWCKLDHTLKVYLPECNLPKEFWKSELKEKLGQKSDAGGSEDDERAPILVDILELYLKEEQNTTVSLSGSFAKLALRRTPESADSNELQADLDKSNLTRRSSSSSLTTSLPPMGQKGGLAPIGSASNATFPTRNYQVRTSTDQAASDDHDGGELDDSSKVLEDEYSLNDLLDFENRPEETPTEHKNQQLNRYWRKNTSVTLFDDVSLGSLEEVVEEEDACYEKESSSSV